MKKTEEKVIRFIKDNGLISPGDRILAALSGGADSVFLLYFLNKFKKKYKIKLGALHINHMLRGKAADADEEFCRKYCNELKISFISIRRNAASFASKRKISVEEAGRIIRYDLLEKTALKESYTKIATAHNSTDNSETVLLNLIKGTGLKGLCGIPLRRGKIIRPLLSLSKDEILKYLQKNNISFRTDETNALNDYERNFLRNDIIPAIKKRLNPSFEEAVFHNSIILKQHYSSILKETDDLISSLVRKEGDELHLSRRLLQYGEPLLSETVKAAVERNFSIQLSFKDVTALTGLFLKKRGSKTEVSGVSASREQDEIVLFRSENDFFAPIEMGINQKVRINSAFIYITEAEKSSFTSRKQGEEYIAADDIDDKFIVRRWEPGDRFFPLGMKGSKKISDFLNERKIDTHLKPKVLLLLNRNRIVWIIGMRLDNRFRITGKTRKILRICQKQEI